MVEFNFLECYYACVCILVFPACIVYYWLNKIEIVKKNVLLSALMRCPTAISRNDPISLANEIQKVLDNSGSDWPFHVIFSGYDR